MSYVLNYLKHNIIITILLNIVNNEDNFYTVCGWKNDNKFL